MDRRLISQIELVKYNTSLTTVFGAQTDITQDIV